MRFEVRSFRAPFWLAPALILLALALIPFVLTLALALLVLGAGAVAFRGLFPSSHESDVHEKIFNMSSRAKVSGNERSDGNSFVIDAEYEVKDAGKKNQNT
jgi:hypothetical protein